MAAHSFIAFLRSFGWKDWLLLVVVAGLHLFGGGRFWPIALPLGVVVGLFLVAAVRVLDRADKARREAEPGEEAARPTEVGRRMDR